LLRAGWNKEAQSFGFRGSTKTLISAGPMSMPIRPFLAEPSAFQPEAIEAVSIAFDEVCLALELAPEQTREREAIAERIIDLGRIGMLDANTLRDRVLKEIPEPNSPS
jgi:hypothetical protein